MIYLKPTSLNTEDACFVEIFPLSTEISRHAKTKSWPYYDLDPYHLTLKTFSAVPTYTTITSAKFHWNPSIK